MNAIEQKLDEILDNYKNLKVKDVIWAEKKGVLFLLFQKIFSKLHTRLHIVHDVLIQSLVKLSKKYKIEIESNFYNCRNYLGKDYRKKWEVDSNFKIYLNGKIFLEFNEKLFLDYIDNEELPYPVFGIKSFNGRINFIVELAKSLNLPNPLGSKDLPFPKDVPQDENGSIIVLEKDNKGNLNVIGKYSSYKDVIDKINFLLIQKNGGYFNYHNKANYENIVINYSKICENIDVFFDCLRDYSRLLTKDVFIHFKNQGKLMLLLEKLKKENFPLEKIKKNIRDGIKELSKESLFEVKTNVKNYKINRDTGYYDLQVESELYMDNNFLLKEDICCSIGYKYDKTYQVPLWSIINQDSNSIILEVCDAIRIPFILTSPPEPEPTINGRYAVIEKDIDGKWIIINRYSTYDDAAAKVNILLLEKNGGYVKDYSNINYEIVKTPIGYEMVKEDKIIYIDSEKFLKTSLYEGIKKKIEPYTKRFRGF